MLFADRDEQMLATLDVIRPDGRPIRELPDVDQLRIIKTQPGAAEIRRTV
jgi:hypothetical protein